MEEFEPVLDTYFPVSHFTQASDEFPPVVSKNLPAAQSAHAMVPLVSLYLPAGQILQGPPSGPVKPLLQEQITLPSDEWESL